MARLARMREGEVRRVLQRGVRLGGERVTVYLAPGTGVTRVAFVCGRAVGGAVERNRARRVLREAWREVSRSVPDGLEVVLVARPAIRGAKTGPVAQELVRTLNRRGVVGRR